MTLLAAIALPSLLSLTGVSAVVVVNVTAGGITSHRTGSNCLAITAVIIVAMSGVVIDDTAGGGGGRPTQCIRAVMALRGGFN